MSLNNPQVQIVRKVQTGQSDKYFLYVTTHFQTTDYESDGNNALSDPVDGVLTVTLKVKKVGEALKINKPVTHQISIDDINLDAVDDFLIVIKEGTTQLASTTIVYQDETETVVRPVHG